MMSSLKVNGFIRSLEGVFSKIDSVIASWDRSIQWNGGKHKRPISEGDKETIKIHIQEVRHVAHQSES